MSLSTPALPTGAARFDTTNDTGVVLPAGQPATPSGTIHFESGRLYIVSFGAHVAAGARDYSTGCTFSHGGTNRTWTFINQSGAYNGGLSSMCAYYRIADVTEDVYFIPDGPGGNNSHNSAIVVEIASGFDASGLIVQSAGNTAAAALFCEVSLPSAPNAANLSLAFFKNQDNTTVAMTPKSGWTELTEVSGTGTGSDSGYHHAQYRTDLSSEQVARADVASTNRDWGGVHMELKAAAAAVGAFPFQRRDMRVIPLI